MYRIEYRTLSSIEPATANPKQHDIGEICASIMARGFVGGIIVDDRTGRLIAGHGRVAALRELHRQSVSCPSGISASVSGEWSVPCIVGWSSNDDIAALQALIADNKLVELGDWDQSGLAELLKDLAAHDALEGVGYDGDDLDALLKDLGQGVELQEVDAEPQTEIYVQPGDVWQCGKHTVVCGDSAVVDYPLIDELVTDPPYGVSYAEKNEFLNAIARGNRNQTPIQNDSHSVEDMGDFWFDIFARVYSAAKPGACYYVTGPQGGDLSMMMMMQKACWLLKHVLIWVKNNHVLGRCDYHYKHEPILYGWKPGAAHCFNGGASSFSVWEYDKPHKSDLHPTMKPVELVAKMIENGSRSNETVCDPFLGSGTTLIACEQLGRVCFGVEIEPRYAQIAIERWKKLTGQDPVLIKREGDVVATSTSAG